MTLEATFGADRVYRVQQDSRPAILTLGAYLPEQAAPGAPYTAYLIARAVDSCRGRFCPRIWCKCGPPGRVPGAKHQDIVRVRLPIVTSGRPSCRCR